MRIIEIQALENGAHSNQTLNGKTPESFPIPNGWAVIPDDMETSNFPFGEVTAEEIDGVMTVTSWTPGTIPEPEPEHKTPAQQREEAYNTQEIIEWDGKMLTVTQAAQQWSYYAAEGRTDKTDALTELIATAKQSLREQCPDDNTEV